MGMKLFENILRRTCKPILLGVTKVLEWTGKIRDTIQSGIDWCQGRFFRPRPDSEDYPEDDEFVEGWRRPWVSRVR